MDRSIAALPHATLGVRSDATAEEVRQAYLELVQRFPPDRHPKEFRNIHLAYAAASDPVVQAKAIIDTCRHVPDLAEVIDEAAQKRPRIPKLVLLSLGN
ncbi:MAG: DnaJ domain-containing protein [Aureliella sp.]|jgi:DnaJ-class molecular chaperone